MINSVTDICILHFPHQHYSFQGIFHTFAYLWSFSRPFKALKFSTLNSRTFYTFQGSVRTLYYRTKKQNLEATLWRGKKFTKCDQHLRQRDTFKMAIAKWHGVQFQSKLPPSKLGRQLVEEREPTGLVAKGGLWTVSCTVSDTTPRATRPTPGNLSVERPTTGNTTWKFCAHGWWNCRMFRCTRIITRSVHTHATDDALQKQHIHTNSTANSIFDCSWVILLYFCDSGTTVWYICFKPS